MVSALGILALISTLACLATLVLLHLLPTGYRPVGNAVSDYGVGPYRRFYRVQTTANAVAAVAVAVALARGVDPAPRRVIDLLAVFAAARLAIPWFPTDVDRSTPTGTGRLHLVLAGLAFGSIAWATAALPDRVAWGGLHGVLVILGWLVVATSIACGLSLRALNRWLGPVFGLVERLFYASMLTWFLVVSIRLI